MLQSSSAVGLPSVPKIHVPPIISQQSQQSSSSSSSRPQKQQSPSSEQQQQQQQSSSSSSSSSRPSSTISDSDEGTPVMQAQPVPSFGPGASPVMQEQPLLTNNLVYIPDTLLKPGALSDWVLQRELKARGIEPVTKRAANIGELIRYLILRDPEHFGVDDSDVDDIEEEEDELEAPGPDGVFVLNEVFLVSGDVKQDAVLKWLTGQWMPKAQELHYKVTIEDLRASHNLIKVRVWNNLGETCSLHEECTQAHIKCARFWAKTRGDDWGGWQYFDGGKLAKSARYGAPPNAEPPLMWKRLCWVENGLSAAEATAWDQHRSLEAFKAEQVRRMYGTDLPLLDCETAWKQEKCEQNQRPFRGFFSEGDLVRRHMCLMSTTTPPPPPVSQPPTSAS